MVKPIKPPTKPPRPLVDPPIAPPAVERPMFPDPKRPKVKKEPKFRR